MYRLVLLSKDEKVSSWFKNYINKDIQLDCRFSNHLTHKRRIGDKNLIIFVVGKLKELENISSYYEAYYCKLTYDDTIYILHQDDSHSMNLDMFPYSESNLFHMHKEWSEFKTSLIEVLDNQPHRKETYKADFIEDNDKQFLKLSPLITQEIALAKRFGHPFTGVAVKIKDPMLFYSVASLFSQIEIEKFQCKLREIDRIFFIESGQIVFLLPATTHEGATIAVNKFMTSVFNILKYEHQKIEQLIETQAITYPHNVSSTTEMIDLLESKV